MINKKIAIIGVGKMGLAIGLGLLGEDTLSEENLILSNPSIDKLNVPKHHKVHLTTSNTDAVRSADIAILAVKPQVIRDVLEEIKHEMQHKLIISIAAGIEMNTINDILGNDNAVVRVMPNLNAVNNKSMSCWVKNPNVTSEDTKIVKEILQVIGKEVELQKEELIDSATAISGSGPAYVFYLAELLENEAVRLGLPYDIAKTLTRQTISGSAFMLDTSLQSPKDLRLSVTSKGGTTEAAFNQFEKDKLSKIFYRGINAAFERAKELHL